MKFHALVMIEVLMVMALFGFNSASVAAEWESTLAAAKKEGKVVGDSGRDRDACAMPSRWNFRRSTGSPWSYWQLRPRVCSPRRC